MAVHEEHFRTLLLDPESNINKWLFPKSTTDDTNDPIIQQEDPAGQKLQKSLSHLNDHAIWVQVLVKRMT